MLNSERLKEIKESWREGGYADEMLSSDEVLELVNAVELMKSYLEYYRDAEYISDGELAASCCLKKIFVDAN